MSTTLHCISTGSVGNSYILDVNGEKLILELGVRWKEILSALDYRLDGVTACICSHRHIDHIKSVPNALSYGLPVYSSADVATIYPKVKVVEPMKKYTIGGFKVLPLEVPHGDCPNLAYHITMPDGQTLLFATDLEKLPYSIKGINHMLIEANYSEELILDSLVNGNILRSQSQNHMELTECISTVKRLRHGGLQSVILIHLSNGLSDENMFKERFKSELGMDVWIGEKNLRFILDKEDF